MTRIWLVRHGPTHSKKMIGWTNSPADLSDAAALARLSDYLPFAPIVASDLIRASATADAIQANRPRLPDDPALREINFGTWENRHWKDINTETPALIRAFWDTPGDVAPPDGESWNETKQRADRAIDGYISNDHDDLIVVCHFGIILTQLQRALAVSAGEVFSHTVDNLSVSILETSPWKAAQINHIP